MKHYTFTYYGWIASSKEIDRDYFTINADSLEVAWEKVKKMKLFPKSVVTLESINGVRVEEAMRAMPVAEGSLTEADIVMQVQEELNEEEITEEIEPEAFVEIPNATEPSEELTEEGLDGVFVEID
jgi:hypothetical protein